MIAYASRTGTRRNLDALRRAGWRLMISARGALRTEGFRYALDNGAWTSSQRGEPFNEAAFERALSRLGANSARRIRVCASAGVDSFDGSGPSRFAVALPRLDLARRQVDLEGLLSRDEIASSAPSSPISSRGGR